MLNLYYAGEVFHMTKEKRTNALAELLRSRDGFVSIREAVNLLGPEEYSRCLVNLTSRDENDQEYVDLFYQNGDSGTGQPTHICFSNAFMEYFCDILDGVLEKHGVLSPRTKGIKII